MEGEPSQLHLGLLHRTVWHVEFAIHREWRSVCKLSQLFTTLRSLRDLHTFEVLRRRVLSSTHVPLALSSTHMPLTIRARELRPHPTTVPYILLGMCRCLCICLCLCVLIREHTIVTRRKPYHLLLVHERLLAHHRVLLHHRLLLHRLLLHHGVLVVLLYTSVSKWKHDAVVD